MIRYILVLLALVLPISTGAGSTGTAIDPHSPVYKHVLKNRPDIDPIYANKLAKAIYNASMRYGLNPNKLSALFAQECMYKLNCVNATKDYSIGQINIKTANFYGFDVNRLLIDLDYSVNCTALILNDLKLKYGNESDYWTRYHSFRPNLRKRYKLAVSRYM